MGTLILPPIRRGPVVDAVSGLDQTGVDTGQRIGGRLRMDGVVAIPRQSNSRCELALAKTARDSHRRIGLAKPCVTCNVKAMASTRDRVREHRERLRQQGLRPVQIWVPDVRAPEFAAEAHRQSAAIAASEQEADDQAFVDAISWASDAEAGPAE